MTPNAPIDLGDGARHWPGLVPPDAAEALARDVLSRCTGAGWLAPVTPGGQPFSVRQMNLGPLGWVSDRRGYRYQDRHPVSNEDWPRMPTAVLEIWCQLIPDAPAPECCLVNHYTDSAKMGLHRDADEDDQTTPILSVSLGAPARFRLGGPKKGDPARSIVLRHGDVLVMNGPSRRHHHGVDRLIHDDDLFAAAPPGWLEGRLSLTLRRVTLVSAQKVC